jgi:hypothetical protein
LQGCDHLILCRKCLCHLPIRGHADIYVSGTSEPGFSGKVWLVLTGSGALCGNS